MLCPLAARRHSLKLHKQPVLLFWNHVISFSSHRLKTHPGGGGGGVPYHVVTSQFGADGQRQKVNGLTRTGLQNNVTRSRRTLASSFILYLCYCLALNVHVQPSGHSCGLRSGRRCVAGINDPRCRRSCVLVRPGNFMFLFFFVSHSL